MPRPYGRKKPGYAEITSQLRDGSFPNVMFLYGPESYLIRWIISEITDRYINEDNRLFDLYRTDGYALDSARPVIEACEMLPLMSEKKVVIVTDLSKTTAGLSELADYLGSVPASTVLIMTPAGQEEVSSAFTAAVNKAGQSYELTRLDRRMLSGFIRKYLKRDGASFASRAAMDEAVNAMIDISGYYDRDSDYTLDNFSNDILKLAMYSDGNLTPADVAEVVTGNDEKNSFALTDALSAGNKQEALRILWSILSHGGNEFSVLGLICSQFEVMMLIQEARERGAGTGYLEKELKINSYRIRRLSGPASHYTSDQLKRILLKAYDIDRNVKTGVMDARLGLEMFIAEV